MAELAEYQQWLRNGIKAGAAGDPNQKYLAHLARYGVDAAFYGGTAQFGNLQYRANNQSNGRDLGTALSSMSGADLQKLLRDKINARPAIASSWNDSGQELQTDTQWAALNPRDLAEVDKIDPNKRYAYAADDAQDHGAQTITGGLGQYREAPDNFDPSKLAGYEIIRPGELDNTVNGIKEQLGANADKADWSQLIKYDPTVGLYTPKGAIKHVNDEGGGWAKYGPAWIKAAFAAAAAAATGGALAPAAGAAIGGATGSAVASTAATAATKALLASAINAGINRQKLTGKNLLIGAISSGVGAGVGNLVANATGTATTGLPALLASGATRSLISNKGKIDPRLLALNTAGAYADGLMGQPVYSLGKTAYGAYNNYNRLQSNNGQARRPVMMQGRGGALLRSGVKPNG